jgi:glyoxylase-like metal-dependent hydrolase (beta-lactamase superfamily II)
VSRIVVTHAHIDHYGLAGRLMELTGAELAMHTHTDLDCEKYRHPDTARARRRDTYADHGVSEAERTDLAEHLIRWMPYLHSVVEASRRLRGGEEMVVGEDRWEVVHTPGHSLGHVCLWSPAHRVLLSGDHLLPAITPASTARRVRPSSRPPSVGRARRPAS